MPLFVYTFLFLLPEDETVGPSSASEAEQMWLKVLPLPSWLYYFPKPDFSHREME